MDSRSPEIEPEQQRDINMNLLARVHRLEQQLKETQEHTLKIFARIFVSNAEVMEELINRIKKLEDHAK